MKNLKIYTCMHTHILIHLNVLVNAENVEKHHETPNCDHFWRRGLEEGWEEVNFTLLFSVLLTLFTKCICYFLNFITSVFKKVAVR